VRTFEDCKLRLPFTIKTINLVARSRMSAADERERATRAAAVDPAKALLLARKVHDPW
jgi:hypothetical protein